jgi:hypothetical protein
VFWRSGPLIPLRNGALSQCGQTVNNFSLRIGKHGGEFFQNLAPTMLDGEQATSKKHIYMHLLTTNGRTAASPWEVKDVCKIVLLCEDALARDRAMIVLNQISALFEGHVALTVTYWDFEQCGQEPGANCMTLAATSADLVLFSMRDGNFPASVGAKPAVALSFANGSAGCLAYVRTKTAHASSEKIIGALQYVGSRSGIELLPLTAESAAPKVQVFRPEEWTVTATRKELDRPHYEHWGLNE